MEESIRMAENTDKWRKYVHGVANPRTEDGWRTKQNLFFSGITVLLTLKACSRNSTTVSLRPNVSTLQFTPLTVASSWIGRCELGNNHCAETILRLQAEDLVLTSFSRQEWKPAATSPCVVSANCRWAERSCRRPRAAWWTSPSWSTPADLSSASIIIICTRFTRYSCKSCAAKLTGSQANLDAQAPLVRFVRSMQVCCFSLENYWNMSMTIKLVDFDEFLHSTRWH